MIADPLERLALNHVPPRETLIWSAEADTEAVKKSAHSRSRLVKIFYIVFLIGTLLLLLAAFVLVSRAGTTVQLSMFFVAFLFVIATFMLRRQILQYREIERSPAPIIYALTDQSFLMILGDSGKVRNYDPKAFKRIKVRPTRRSKGGIIDFGWERMDIGGKYTEALFLKNDPIPVAELISRNFSAEIRS